MTMDVNSLVGFADETNQAKPPVIVDGVLISNAQARDMPLLLLGERGVPPRLARVIASSPTSIRVFFNMRMNAADAVFLGYYTLTATGGATVRNISSITVASTLLSVVTLTLDGAMSADPDFTYELDVSPLIRGLRGTPIDPTYVNANVEAQLCSGLIPE